MNGNWKLGRGGGFGLVVLLAGGAFGNLLSPNGAQAQSSIPREETWVAEWASVRAMVCTDDTVYIGGDFTYVGPSTGCFVPIDAATGRALDSFPKANDNVEACVPDGAGGWYIGGYFSGVGGVMRNRVAHILGDGSVDPAFNPGEFGPIGGWVNVLAVSGSTLYVGGSFTRIGGQPRSNIAALDAATGQVTAWTPNADLWPYALAVSGSTIYVGGNFTSIGGQPRVGIAALDTITGQATAWNPSAGGTYPTVEALAVSGSTVYVGGSFTSIGGQPRVGIAALDAATGQATAWNPSAGGVTYPEVAALAVSGSTVYVGGGFTTIGGQPRNDIAAIDVATGQATPWNSNANGIVGALAVSGSTVYAGGAFTSIGGQPRNRIAALDATTGQPMPWDPNVGPGSRWGSTVRTIAVSGSTVYVGGYFASVGGVTRNHVAALNVATGRPTAWNPDADGWVDALALSGPTLYVGGEFGRIGGQPRNSIAALDAATGQATAWDPNADNDVDALAVSGSTVYVGGGFTTIGGQPRNSIAALDAVTGQATAWNPNADSSVGALAVSGSTVYVGGAFTTIGGQPRNGIAALDAATGQATAWNPSATGHAETFVVSGSTVYTGGNFTSIGGQARDSIAALDTVTGQATAWNPSPGGSIRSVHVLALSGSTLYVGGEFASIGGLPRRGVAALDVATGQATAWDPGMNARANSTACGPVRALSVSGASVYVAGGFRIVGSEPRSFFAQFDFAPRLAAKGWHLY